MSSPLAPVVLVVMDGVGVGAADEFDCVSLAHTPNLDRLAAAGVCRTLRAHGVAVGLPSDADMGNSEVGHNILGSGRISPQGASQVADALATGRIWESEGWAAAVAAARAGGTLHLLGLLSDGGVHAHVDHLLALLVRATADGVTRIRIHALFDGRDVPQGTAERYVADVQEVLAGLEGDVAFASGGGRMVTTMDRYEADWSVVAAGWHAHVLGDAHPVESVEAGLAWGRGLQGEKDQYLPAFTVVGGDGRPVGAVEDGDAVVLFNFRGDRAIEIARAFESGPEFVAFDRVRAPDVVFVGMTQYDGDLGVPRQFLVSPAPVDRVVSELIADAGLRQWACSETQKFGHVTYFWNGNRSGKFDEDLEEYVEVPSDQVPFDQRPWMKCAEIADETILALESGRFAFLRLNLAAGDMVGHTGDVAASRVAVEAVDLALGRIFEAVSRVGGTLLVTADHGNCDDMVERDADGAPLYGPDGRPRARTAHSLNAVPFIAVSSGPVSLVGGLPDAGLANVAASILTLLDLPVPDDYEPSLLEVRRP